MINPVGYITPNIKNAAFPYQSFITGINNLEPLQQMDRDLVFDFKNVKTDEEIEALLKTVSEHTEVKDSSISEPYVYPQLCFQNRIRSYFFIYICRFDY